MTRLQLLASTGPMFARPLDWALGVVAEAGYDGAELMVTQDPATQDPERVADLAHREGAAVPVVHGPFLLLTRRVFGADLVVKARRSLEFAAGIDAGLMIVHPPFRWQQRFHQWLTEEADLEAAAAGVDIGVENLFPVPFGGRHFRLHRYTEPAHLQPFKHLVFDTSHFAVADIDIVTAWRSLAPATAHLHLSDNRGQGRDSHAGLGHGILPLASFLTEVTRSGFTGAITLEVDCRRYLDDRAALVGYLRQEREKCQALLDGAPAEEVLGRPDRPAAPPPGEDVSVPVDV